jgi:hypothetical protein
MDCVVIDCRFAKASMRKRLFSSFIYKQKLQGLYHFSYLKQSSQDIIYKQEMGITDSWEFITDEQSEKESFSSLRLGPLV